MKTDQQLEDVLRATLNARASTVDGGPAWPSSHDTAREPDDGDAHGREYLDVLPRSVPWRFAPLAAAVLVALAVAGILLGTRVTDENSAAPVPVTHRQACLATNLAQWQQALDSSTHVVADDQAVDVVGMTSDGTAVGTQLAQGDRTSRLTIGTVSFQSNAFRPLVSIAGTTENVVETSAQVAGDNAVVAVNFASGHAPTPAPNHVVLVDIATGHQTTLMSPHGAHPSTSDLAVIFDGAVYWDEYPAGDTTQEIVHEYTIATGRQRVVYDGPATPDPRFGNGMGVSAAGVWWSGTARQPNRPAQLPDEVVRNATSETARESLHTDGTSYAWRTASTIDWWSPGKGITSVDAPASFISAVAGPLVFYSAGTNSPMRVVDVRTGTVVTAQSAVPTLATRNGVAVFGPDGSTSVIRLDTATLPPLPCG